MKFQIQNRGNSEYHYTDAQGTIGEIYKGPDGLWHNFVPKLGQIVDSQSHKWIVVQNAKKEK